MTTITSDEAVPAHHLWLQQARFPDSQSLYQLRVSVVKDSEEQGDCKSQSLFFETPGAFQTATERICTLFRGAPYDYTINISDSAPSSLGEATTKNYHARNLLIMFESGVTTTSWAAFVKQLSLTMGSSMA